MRNSLRKDSDTTRYTAPKPRQSARAAARSSLKLSIEYKREIRQQLDGENASAGANGVGGGSDVEPSLLSLFETKDRKLVFQSLCFIDTGSRSSRLFREDGAARDHGRPAGGGARGSWCGCIRK